MRKFLHQLRQDSAWAIRYNHSWDPCGYAIFGIWYFLLMTSLLVTAIMSGSYPAIALFSAYSVVGIRVGRFIYSVIKEGEKDEQ